MPLHISKSKYLSGLQCPKLVWTHFNQRELIPEPDAAQQHIFDTGHTVGDLAKELYPNGVEVPMNFNDLAVTAADTEQLLNRPVGERVPIFEASFLIDSRYCRVDILVPVPDEPGEVSNRWDLIEVKSSTRVRDININDIAFQRDALSRSGVKLRTLYLMHVDTAYVRGDEFDVQQFFHLEDVTTRATSLFSYVAPAVDKMLATITGPDPDTPIGTRCTKPYTCPLIPHCWSVLPKDNVTDLYYGGRRAFELLDEGLFTIADVPDDRLSFQQKIQKQTVISGKPHVDVKQLRPWLDELSYPLYHLDFETMNPAIPPFAGVRPYQRIPFQFSLHIQDEPGAEPRHVEFLAHEAADPRADLLAALHAIGDEGTILAWYTSFEKGVLSDLGELFPAEAEWLAGLNERMVDLMVPFRNFWYHHPAQRGRCSLKAVLPALTPLGYGGLVIADGNHAARAFAEVLFGRVAPELKDRVLAQLREYCQLDTLAMVEILRVVEGAVS